MTASMVTTLFVGPGGTFATLPMKILMFRDNVQHHLQAGRPWPGYPWIHAVADAVIGVATTRPPADELWAEISLASAGLRDIGIDDLAMSIRTRSTLTAAPALPEVRGTLLLRRVGWLAPLRIKGRHTLGELFADVVCGIERITHSGNARGDIEVTSRPESVIPARRRRRRIR